MFFALFSNVNMCALGNVFCMHTGVCMHYPDVYTSCIFTALFILYSSLSSSHEHLMCFFIYFDVAFMHTCVLYPDVHLSCISHKMHLIPFLTFWAQCKVLYFAHCLHILHCTHMCTFIRYSDIDILHRRTLLNHPFASFNFVVIFLLTLVFLTSIIPGTEPTKGKSLSNSSWHP